MLVIMIYDRGRFSWGSWMSDVRDGLFWIAAYKSNSSIEEYTCSSCTVVLVLLCIEKTKSEKAFLVKSPCDFCSESHKNGRENTCVGVFSKLKLCENKWKTTVRPPPTTNFKPPQDLIAKSANTPLYHASTYRYHIPTQRLWLSQSQCRAHQMVSSVHSGNPVRRRNRRLSGGMEERCTSIRDWMVQIEISWLNLMSSISSSPTM